MPIELLVWDIGGVLLSNGWDHAERAMTAEQFGLDLSDLDERVERHAPAYETGTTTLDDFFGATVFYLPRPFTKTTLREFVFGLSRPNEPVLQLARSLASRGETRMVALNNEGAEFNRHRIETFGLQRILTAFFSSCYTGLRKPDPAAFRMVSDVLQVTPNNCLFIDDRRANIDAADRFGWNTILYEDASQLRSRLKANGIAIP